MLLRTLKKGISTISLQSVYLRLRFHVNYNLLQTEDVTLVYIRLNWKNVCNQILLSTVLIKFGGLKEKKSCELSSIRNL